MATALQEVFASTNIVILALISGNAAAGYFAAGDKLIRAALGILSPLRTAAYPRISYLMHHARDDAFAFLRRMLAVQGSVVAMISLAVLVAGPFVVHLLYGQRFEPTVGVLRWMAFVPLASGLADIFGIQTMLPLGMKTQFSRVLFGSAVLNFMLLPVLAKLFAEQGAAATVLIVQTCVAIAMATTLYMQGVSFLKRRVAE